MASPSRFGPDTVWLVTGASSGLGAAFAKHILVQGHNIVATARNVSSLSYLPSSSKVLKLSLDVTSIPSIKAAFASAIETFGHVDIVVNNAGYLLIGDTENATDEEARKEIDTNFWGVVDMSKEAVRIMRDVNGKRNDGKPKGGLVIQVSSLGGQVAVAGNAFYHASKFGLEGFTEAFSKEIPPDWNINFLILEPGGVKSNFGTSSLKMIARHPAYADEKYPTRQLEKFMLEGDMDKQTSDPARVVEVVFDVVAGKIKATLQSRLKDMDDWKEVSESTMTEEVKEAVRKGNEKLGL
ncbi:NAD(P)-binding protein [Mollisia scopiformis]|uniref:NAD(P)-binding protein n=1 Tax=Mollisia scopiformis TaxID=149040 RepID=A0A132B7Q0_MOLSC|nr:NAD(P)-binding protein [Mollisia scopiformis]KUJ08426.1 NAD(P)-binding protein [Mollisia scopiformis]